MLMSRLSKSLLERFRKNLLKMEESLLSCLWSTRSTRKTLLRILIFTQERWSSKVQGSLASVAVEIKGSDVHANSENTFDLKKSPAKTKAKIPEGEEDKHFKPDHF